MLPARETYRVETWGCQMNVLDGERMAGQLEALGLRARRGRRGRGRAKVVILNTCAVREKAEDKVYSALGVLGAPQARGPGPGHRRDRMRGAGLGSRDPRAGALGGLRGGHRPGREARRARRGRAGRPPPGDARSSCRTRTPSTSSARSPAARPSRPTSRSSRAATSSARSASSRSRGAGSAADRAAEILEELPHLAARGYTEVTLLGQTVNAYREPEEGFGLGELLRRAGRVEGLRRLRFLTSHPRLVDEDLARGPRRGRTDRALPPPAGPVRLGPGALADEAPVHLRPSTARRRAHPAAGCPASPSPRTSSSGFRARRRRTSRTTLALVRDAALREPLRLPLLAAARDGRRRGGGARSRSPEETAVRRLQVLLDLQAGIQRESNRAPRRAGVRDPGRGQEPPRPDDAGARPATASCTSRRVPRPTPSPRAATPGSGSRGDLPNSLAGRLAA